MAERLDPLLRIRQYICLTLGDALLQFDQRLEKLNDFMTKVNLVIWIEVLHSIGMH